MNIYRRLTTTILFMSTMFISMSSQQQMPFLRFQKTEPSSVVHLADSSTSASQYHRDRDYIQRWHADPITSTNIETKSKILQPNINSKSISNTLKPGQTMHYNVVSKSAPNRKLYRQPLPSTSNKYANLVSVKLQKPIDFKTQSSNVQQQYVPIAENTYFQFRNLKPNQSFIKHQPASSYSQFSHNFNDDIRNTDSISNLNTNEQWIETISKPETKRKSNRESRFQSYDEKPDGYDIFEQGQNQFNKEKQLAEAQFKYFPTSPKIIPTHDDLINSEDHYLHETTEFTPTRLYTQVRKHKNVKHLPKNLVEPRLKEIISNIRIHTTYTEDGTEDEAYDHGDREKNANNSEEFEENYNNQEDSSPEGSSYHHPAITKHKSTKVEFNKMTELKEIDNGMLKTKQFNNIKLILSPSNQYEPIHFAQIDAKVDNKTAHSIMQDVGKHFRTKRQANIAINKKLFPRKVLTPNVKINLDKYPYYYNKDININSPLRYAENLKRAPMKKLGEMTFYINANKIKCSEIQSNIEPTKKHSKENTRVVGLGDKIDCLKIRYFGEDPLDSPFFKEESISDPDPIFKEFRYLRKPRSKLFKRQTRSLKQESTDINEIASGNALTNATPIESVDQDQVNGTEHLPEPEALRNKRRKIKFIIQSTKRKPIHINLPVRVHKRKPVPKPIHKPVSKYPRHTGASASYHYTTVKPVILPFEYYEYQTTVLPTPNAFSEVQYKDDIKPIEQLNVLEDVINNIKDSTSYQEIEFRPYEDAVTHRQRLKVTHPRPNSFDQLSSSSIPNWKKLLTTTTTPRSKFVPSKTRYRKPNIEHFTTSPIKDMYKKGFSSNFGNNNVGDFDKTYNDYKEVFGSEDDIFNQFYDTVETTTMTYKRTKKRKKAQHKIPKESILEVVDLSDRDFLDQNPNRKRKTNGELSYSTIDVPVNKFLVPGMKPPSILDKPFVYSDFRLPLTGSKFRRQDFLNLGARRKRSTRRLSYSEIKREPTKKPDQSAEIDVDDDDDDDDYVPRRPTNFHYDPKTDKIIYDKKKETTTKEMVDYEYEIEEEIVTEKPKKTTTHRTIYHKDVLDKANGPTLVDFLLTLRNDPSYKYIADPEPTEKPEATTSSTTTSTSIKSTTPPEFLNFLNKLHQHKDYVQIADEDKKLTKQSKTTTTDATVDEEEEEEDAADSERINQKDIQNAPGGQFNLDPDEESVDRKEYSPNSKTYAPKTSIDYSKYKPIERTTIKASEKQFEDEELESPNKIKIIQNARQKYENIKATEDTVDEEYVDAKISTKDKDVGEFDDEVTTTTTTTTTTKAPRTTVTIRLSENSTRVKIRNKKRPSTTTRTTTITSAIAESITNSTEILDRPTNKPPMRVYRRRQRPKIQLSASTEASKSKSTSTESLNDLQDKYVSPKTVAKRNQVGSQVPYNHKAIYTPIIVLNRFMALTRHNVTPVDKAMNKTRTIKFLQKHKHTRMVTPDILNFNKTNSTDRRKLEVETFKQYNENLKHGGNYLQEEETNNNNTNLKNDSKIFFLINPVWPNNINNLKSNASDTINRDNYTVEDLDYDLTPLKDLTDDFDNITEKYDKVVNITPKTITTVNLGNTEQLHQTSTTVRTELPDYTEEESKILVNASLINSSNPVIEERPNEESLKIILAIQNLEVPENRNKESDNLRQGKYFKNSAITETKYADISSDQKAREIMGKKRRNYYNNTTFITPNISGTILRAQKSKISEGVTPIKGLRGVSIKSTTTRYEDNIKIVPAAKQPKFNSNLLGDMIQKDIKKIVSMEDEYEKSANYKNAPIKSIIHTRNKYEKEINVLSTDRPELSIRKGQKLNKGASIVPFSKYVQQLPQIMYDVNPANINNKDYLKFEEFGNGYRPVLINSQNFKETPEVNEYYSAEALIAPYSHRSLTHKNNKTNLDLPVLMTSKLNEKDSLKTSQLSPNLKDASNIQKPEYSVNPHIIFAQNQEYIYNEPELKSNLPIETKKYNQDSLTSVHNANNLDDSKYNQDKSSQVVAKNFDGSIIDIPLKTKEYYPSEEQDYIKYPEVLLARNPQNTYNEAEYDKQVSDIIDETSVGNAQLSSKNPVNINYPEFNQKEYNLRDQKFESDPYSIKLNYKYNKESEDTKVLHPHDINTYIYKSKYVTEDPVYTRTINDYPFTSPAYDYDFSDSSSRENYSSTSKSKNPNDGRRNPLAMDYDYEDEVKMYFKNKRRTPEGTVMKDPGQRFYFYASTR